MIDAKMTDAKDMLASDANRGEAPSELLLLEHKQAALPLPLPRCVYSVPKRLPIFQKEEVARRVVDPVMRATHNLRVASDA